jgi:hypothetical protein
MALLWNTWPTSIPRAESCPGHASSGRKLSGPERHRQVEQRAVLEELGREAGIGTEQQPALAVDDAVSRWGTDIGGEPGAAMP